MQKCKNEIYGEKNNPYLVRQILRVTEGSTTYTALIVPAKIIKLLKSSNNTGKKFWWVAEPEMPVGNTDPLAISDGINHIKITTDIAGATPATADVLINTAGKRKKANIQLGLDSSGVRFGMLGI